jgi:Ca2+:H+ antiporter
MYLDSVRRQAHRVASSQGGDGTMNYNPFARTRSRDTIPDLENPVHRTRSEPAAPTIEEQQRLESSHAAEKEFGHQRHHNTEPTPTTPTAPNGFSTVPGSSVEKDIAPPTNGNVHDSANSTMASPSNQNTNGVTKRAKFKGIFRKDHEGAELEDSELTQVDSDQLSLEERKKRAHKQKIPIGKQIRFVLFGAWINVLLVFVPVGFGVYYAKDSEGKRKVGPVPIFIINFVAIIPLAAMLSNATEELAIRVGETLGGLLNATFGNAVELIVSVQALIKDEITIVKTSLIGSMLSNLLLVLGMSFFLGGVNRLEQFFNVTVAQTASSLLALCIASLIIPTVFHNMIAEDSVIEGDAKKNQELVRSQSTTYLHQAYIKTVARNSRDPLARLRLLSDLSA